MFIYCEYLQYIENITYSAINSLLLFEILEGLEIEQPFSFEIVYAKNVHANCQGVTTLYLRPPTKKGIDPTILKNRVLLH